MGLYVFAGFLISLCAQAQEIRLAPVATTIDAPTDIQHAGDGSGRLFLVEQNGLIRVLRNGTLQAAPFLDVRSKTRAGGERGLLGLAFSPSFSSTGRFFVNYTNLAGNTIVAQYQASPGADAADAATETILLEVAQPFSNHNGGQIRFGPDGYLYIGMGDGGSAGDPQNNGQNRGSLLGKMLRVDVESEPGRLRIPADNPFVNTAGARPEIWAFGLRNPWRFSFDRATGDLWIGDVGQNLYEEIDYQPATSRGGENYGWNTMEGMHCFRGACSTQGLVLPVAEYGRNDGCSVTGGFVYRGSRSPGLRGTYIYADYCSGRIWGLERRGTEWVNRLLLASGLSITTFGEDENGEVYLADAGRDTVYRVDGDSAPRFSAAGVVNAASFEPGLVPGSLATVFASGLLDGEDMVMATQVPLPTELRGVSVMVGSTAAPLLGIANQSGNELVNFQVPLLTGAETVSLIVSRNGNRSAPVSVPVLRVQPAVYTAGGIAIVVRLPDYTLTSEQQPLRRGDFAFLYANGLGAANNAPPVGNAAPATPAATTTESVRVTIGGVACPVQFSGFAPALVGVYQVNFQVSADTPRGVQDLVITIAGVSSPAVKVAVE